MLRGVVLLLTEKHVWLEGEKLPEDKYLIELINNNSESLHEIQAVCAVGDDGPYFDSLSVVEVMAAKCASLTRLELTSAYCNPIEEMSVGRSTKKKYRQRWDDAVFNIVLRNAHLNSLVFEGTNWITDDMLVKVLSLGWYFFIQKSV
jgi:hypothetical protein